MTLVNNPRRALAALILITFLVRLGWAVVIEAGNDEAYNYLYSVYPDWSYFDHPPMTMCIDKAGLFLCGGNVNLLSLRLGYLLLFAGSTWILYRITSRWYGAWAGFYASLALNLSVYYSAVIGVFAVPDGPFLFFTLLTLWALSEALVGSPGKVRPWIWVGLAWAGALLTKYHAVFLPAAALVYVILTPQARRVLRSPGPYLAVALGSLAFCPVLLWNGEHGWASFVFQGSRALGWHARPHGPLLLALASMGLLLPWIFVPLVKAVINRLRGPALAEIDRLLLCFASVPLAFFLAVSCGRRVFPHWSLMGFVPLFCLVGQRWANLAQATPARSRRQIIAMSAALLAMVAAVGIQVRFGVATFLSRDPCREFSGWESVGREIEARGLIQPNTFLFTDSWHDSGHLALAVRNQAPVLCYNMGDARGFAFWTRPEQWVGKDGLLVSLHDDPKEPGQFEHYFQHIELVATFPMTRGGKPFRNVKVFRCIHQIEPFPFTYSAPPLITD
jgi:hypothetical protein